MQPDFTMLSVSKGQLVELHPKLVDKWARRYIYIYNAEGAVFAKRWASTFLPEAARTAMSIRAREILDNKKGPEKGPDDGGKG